MHQLRRATFTGNKSTIQPVPPPEPQPEPSQPSGFSPSFSLLSFSSLSTYLSTRVSFAITRERPYSLSSTSSPLAPPNSPNTMSMRHSESSLPRQKKGLFENIDSRHVNFDTSWTRENNEEKGKESREGFQLDNEEVEGDKKH